LLRLPERPLQVEGGAPRLVPWSTVAIVHTAPAGSHASHWRWLREHQAYSPRVIRAPANGEVPSKLLLRSCASTKLPGSHARKQSQQFGTELHPQQREDREIHTQCVFVTHHHRLSNGMCAPAKLVRAPFLWLLSILQTGWQGCYSLLSCA
jgi:hypothetical protein